MNEVAFHGRERGRGHGFGRGQGRNNYRFRGGYVQKNNMPFHQKWNNSRISQKKEKGLQNKPSKNHENAY
ncbi:unnamed protein product [Camellia sinensis]